MRKFLLSLICLLTLGFAVNAAEVYVLNLDKSATRESCNQYNKEWKVTKDSQTWSVKGFSNNSNGWEYIAGGTKTANSVLDYIYIASDFALDSTIEEVIITGYKRNTGNLDHFKSCKLQTSTNANFTNLTNDIEIAESSFGTSSGDIKVTLDTPVSNQYVRLYLNMQLATNNGWLAISKITFNGTSSSVITYPTDCAKPAFFISGEKVDGNTADAYAGTKISVACDTKDATTIWNYSSDTAENVTIEGDEFEIPTTAKVGDVFTFSATSEVMGEFGPITASNYLEVKILSAPLEGYFYTPSVEDAPAYATKLVNKSGTSGGSNNTATTALCGYSEGFTSGLVNITFSNTDGSNFAYINKDNTLSIYKGNTFVISVANGYYITSISFDKTNDNLKADDGNFSSGKWTNKDTEMLSSVKFTFSSNASSNWTSNCISTIKVVYEAIPAVAPEVPAVHEESEVTIADGNSITRKGTLKFNVPEGVKVYYKLDVKTPGANDNGENSDNNLDNSNIGDDSQAAQRATRADADADHSSHDGFAEYDHATGIEINDTHSQLTYIACDPVSGLHSEPVVLAVAIPTGVAEIEAAGEGEAVYFNLQGVRVSGNEPGLYIRVVNGKASKILR